ncbi:MAG: hypothetical protein U0229_10895 [Anaeromyxobacter sp.]
MDARARIALLTLLVSACTTRLEVPEGALVTCATTADCPAGRVCSSRGRCTDGADVQAPGLLGNAARVSPALGRAGTAFTVRLEATEPLEAPPRAILGLSPLVELDCAREGAGDVYTCPYAATGQERGGLGGRVPVDVRLTDLAGNENVLPSAGALVLDFAAPVLAARSVEPAAPGRVRVGAPIQVFLTTDEDLGRAPVLVASRALDDGGGPRTRFTPTQQPGTRNWVFTHVVGPLDASGPVAFTAELADLAGNAAAGVEVGAVTIDAEVPVLSGLAASPGRIRAAGAVTATFDASEPAPPDGLAVTIGGRPMTCGAYSATSPSYTCTRAMTGDELPAGAEVAQAVVVLLADAAGNTAGASASVVFDFRPPGVAGASLVLSPAPGGPLTSVRRAAAGTRVSVTVLADEALDAAAPPTLTATAAGQTLALPYVPGGSTATAALFQATVPAGLPDGSYGLSLALADAAGNAATITAGLPALPVKTSTPALAVDQAQLTWVRSPLGDATAEPRGGYALPAGPYVAVEPADPLSGAAALPAGSLALADGGALALVLVRAGASASAPLLGVLRPDAAGVIARGPLSTQDAVAAFLVGVDDAGNVTPPVKLAASEWIATTQPPAFGVGPHALLATRHATPTLLQEIDVTVPAAGPAGGLDAQALLAQARPAWRERELAGAPSARFSHAMAYDAARGRTVLFGGTEPAASPADTWEFDGSRWERVATSGPGPRSQPALAYDAARQRVVLFGGYTSAAGLPVALGDTWEWDGRRWTQVASTGPSPRAEVAMTFDPARGRVVAFGGYVGAQGTPSAETWEWDGAAWTLAASTGPSARGGTALAFDGNRGRVILFGGTPGPGVTAADLWEWSGSAWAPIAATGPGARSQHALAWDPGRRRVVLTGGANLGAALGDTWEWNGAAWALVAPSGLGDRQYHAAVHDTARGRTVVFGGLSGASDHLADTVEWNGAAWARAGRDLPPARRQHAMVHDAARGRTVLFGGDGGAALLADTWTFTGSGWELGALGGPAARSQHALAYDAGRGRVVLFGGAGTGTTLFGDTLEWNGTQWLPMATGGPAARRFHAMAFDAARGRTVLFGGTGAGNALLGDTWEWDGAAWSLRASAGPGARTGASMAYDPVRGRTVLYGGSPNGATTWEWDGTAWAQRATTGPALASNLVFDPVRGRVALLSDGFMQQAFEWTGAAWREVPTSGPTGRRFETALAFDTGRSRWMLFGGALPSGLLSDTWEWTSAPPALQLDASFAEAGVDPGRVQALTVRAFAGGAPAAGAAAGAGARLLAWSSMGAAGEPGAWLPLAASAAGVAAAEPYLPAAPASLVAWSSASAAEARRLVGGRASTISVRVEPAAATVPGSAVVALDYLEVRVRYATP